MIIDTNKLLKKLLLLQKEILSKHDKFADTDEESDECVYASEDYYIIGNLIGNLRSITRDLNKAKKGRIIELNSKYTNNKV